MMKKILTRLIQYQQLEKEEAKQIIIKIADGQYNASQIASFLTVYMMRNISLNELEGFREALVLLDHPSAREMEGVGLRQERHALCRSVRRARVDAADDRQVRCGCQGQRGANQLFLRLRFDPLRSGRADAAEGSQGAFRRALPPCARARAGAGRTLHAARSQQSVALADGVVHSAEREFLAKYQMENAITDAEHVASLEANGWTAAQWDAGVQEGQLEGGTAAIKSAIPDLLTQAGIKSRLTDGRGKDKK